MPTLTSSEVEQFLDEREHLLRIGTVDSDGTPRVVPIWFIRDGHELLFTPRTASVFWANLKRDPRVGISIDEDVYPYRKLTVQGSVETRYDAGRDAEWREVYRAIARRYVADEVADGYIENTLDQPRPLLALSLVEGKVTTWRMPSEGENPSGIWARRYYLDGTVMARLADS